jgi:glycosyltransferase involved in cell wall biosynthesis
VAVEHDHAVPRELQRLGLNALFLVPGETGGMETYARRLVPALAAASPELELVAFVGEEALERLGPEPFGARVRAVSVGVPTGGRARRVLAEQLTLPRLAQREHVDLLHSMGTTAPVRVGVPSVVTVHDVIYATHPQAHTTLMRLGMRVLVPLAVRGADYVITPSHAAAADVVRILGLPADRVRAIHSAGGLPPGPATPEREVRERHGLGDGPLVLSVSARRPHKNLLRLVEAFARVPAEASLVLPGYRTGFEPELEATVRKLGLTERVKALDWVSETDLEGLYRAAACFVFPSLAEGFGLPVLEAMERGVPVATSRAASLTEIGGDAVLYFDPSRVGEIASAITELLKDEELAQRLRAAGPVRAREFSWDDTAAKTLEVYRSVLAK